jgi:hypothetical protein
MKTLLILTLLLSLTLAQSASAYTVETDHPRLFHNSTTVASVVGKCKSAESAFYETHKTYVDANWLDDTYPLSALLFYPMHMASFGILNAVESPDTAYYHEAKDVIAYIWAQASWEETEEYQRTMALMYDWFHGELTTGNLVGRYRDSLVVATGAAVGNYTWHTTNPGHSKLSRMQGLTMTGIALGLDGDAADDVIAVATLDSSYACIFGANQGVIAMTDSFARDGGHYAGNTYNYGGVNDYQMCLWHWNSGTDVAAFDSTSCAAGFGDWHVWNTLPDYGAHGLAYAVGKQGDSPSYEGPRGSYRWVINLLATAYQNEQAQWLEDQFASQFSYFNNYEKHFWIMAHDTLLASTSPPDASWPIAKQFDIGDVFMRNGWTLTSASTDVWAVYRHEQYPFGHIRADAGHIEIWRGQDPLLITGGYYDGGATNHHLEYMSHTISVNSITIRKAGETFTAGSENSGGQDWADVAHPLTLSAYTTQMESANEGRGTITDFSVVGDTLVYIRSNLTDAYSATKVDTVRREVVWLEPKDTFLIFDTVKLDSTNFLQKQLFHMVPNPTTLSSAARWTEVDATMKLTSLFATGNATLTEVGGVGHHFDVNGTNYGAEEEYYDEGDYRIEVSPGQLTDHRWMLTALQVTASADTSYSTLALVTTGDYIGAVVDGDTVLFHKYGGAYATGQSAAAATLDLPTTTLSYTYADSSLQKFGIGNSGDGILSWESTFLSDWIADAANDTGTVGVGYDSVTVQLKWAEIDSAAVWSDTIAVSGGGDGQVIINVKGKIVYVPPTINPALYQKAFFQDLYAASDTVCCHSSHWDVIVPVLVYAGNWEIYPFGAKSKVADGLNIKVTLAKSDNGWSDTFFVPIDHEHWKNEVTLRQLFSTAIDSIAVQAADGLIRSLFLSIMNIGRMK